MSKDRIKIAPELFDIMPVEYQDLVQRAKVERELRVKRAHCFTHRRH